MLNLGAIDGRAGDRSSFKDKVKRLEEISQ
jgi:hypothetical protein